MSGTLTFPDHLSTKISPYLPPAKPSNDLPHLTLTFATSLDSALSLAPGTQTHLSGPLSKAMTHYLRSFHSAILVGVSTAVADDPGLNCRIEGVVGNGVERQPIPIILDPKGRWEVTDSSRVINTAKEGKGRAPFVLVASGNWQEDVLAERKKVVERYGGGYIGVDLDDNGRFRWKDILLTLKRELGVESVMVEGGGSVINSLLEDEGSRQLVGGVIVTIAPTWLGKGGVVVSPDRKVGGDDKYTPPRLKEVKWIPMEEDVVLCGRL
ncbi:2,5-diamino-6-(ribosylamino)-4(3H)-pyrimidinone 5'-phosphate reductase [Arthrobotrys megalospora]